MIGNVRNFPTNLLKKLRQSNFVTILRKIFKSTHGRNLSSFCTFYCVSCLFTIVLPGKIEIVLSALRTRKVRRPARLPISIKLVRYPENITRKSSQFHGFLKYVLLFRMNPLATTLITISTE